MGIGNTGTVPSSFGGAALVVPSDTLDCDCAAFFATGAGNITFLNAQSVSILLTAVPVYTVIPVAAKRIMSTGTTSTGIIALT